MDSSGRGEGGVEEGWKGGAREGGMADTEGEKEKEGREGGGRRMAGRNKRAREGERGRKGRGK